jgi:hypothetical protein
LGLDVAQSICQNLHAVHVTRPDYLRK